MIHAIILAAGESRRMGKQKLLLPYGGKTVIEHIVTQVLQCGVGGITVVLGHDAGEIAAKLTTLPVQRVVNDEYAGGMITSVRSGLESVPPEASAAMIALGGSAGYHSCRREPAYRGLQDGRKRDCRPIV